ncbi:hypothetical protein BDP55DRAFT_628447 [Colletotrichum godetiae]|uniref:Uncharacterized protein n=1 Tax=Colletotrichum godetiae TaxID=1209918 RepID=A0AAJ0AT67_9PEZI|nr:uncharacterized protein BDP55DRAFT_628447 [Colletotrichum godetiae]KAK1689910.1 hypothetical protein BDP55DRAFT_628447 [Colletotrichum godetiae]
MNYIVRSVNQGAASTGEKRRSPSPVIALARRSCDVALPTVESRASSQLNLSTHRAPSATRSPTSTNTDVEHVEIKNEASVLENAVISDRPPEKIFFFKRMVAGCPHFDALIEVGQGQMRLSAEQARIEYAIWEVTEDLFIYRQAGPDFRILQSIGSIEYHGANHEKDVKYAFTIKTCGFIGQRDANNQLNVVKLTVSGKSFLPHREIDKKNFLHHAKWHKRVKNMARHLGLNLRTFYDGGGKPMTAKNCGDWRAGHIEKKLATHIAYAMLKYYDIKIDKKHDASLRDLDRLRQHLKPQGAAPHFEIHLSRGPCGTLKRPGQCLPFEENVILDGSVPPKPEARKVNNELCALNHRENLPSSGIDDVDYDSEEEDLLLHLADAESQKDDIVFDGFDDADDERTHHDRANIDDDTADAGSSPLPQLQVPAEVVANFGENLRTKYIRKEKRPVEPAIDLTTETTVEAAEDTVSVEEIERDLSHIDIHRAPSQSQYWEAPAAAATHAVPSVRRGAATATAGARKRRAKKLEKRRNALGKVNAGKTRTQNAVLLGCWLTACWIRGFCVCGSPGGDARLQSTDWLMQLIAD